MRIEPSPEHEPTTDPALNGTPLHEVIVMNEYRKVGPMMRLLVVAVIFGCGAKAASPGLVVQQAGDTVVTVRASAEGRQVQSDMLEILTPMDSLEWFQIVETVRGHQFILHCQGNRLLTMTIPVAADSTFPELRTAPDSSRMFRIVPATKETLCQRETAALWRWVNDATLHRRQN